MNSIRGLRCVPFPGSFFMCLRGGFCLRNLKIAAPFCEQFFTRKTAHSPALREGYGEFEVASLAVDRKSNNW